MSEKYFSLREKFIALYGQKKWAEFHALYIHTLPYNAGWQDMISVLENILRKPAIYELIG